MKGGEWHAFCKGMLGLTFVLFSLLMLNKLNWSWFSCIKSDINYQKNTKPFMFYGYICKKTNILTIKRCVEVHSVDSVCVCGYVRYANCRANHLWHINYRKRCAPSVLGWNGTLIATKEDLSVQHWDICQSVGQCSLFLILFHDISLAGMSHLAGNQQTGSRRERTAAI